MFMSRAYGDLASPTRVTVEVKFDKVYVVIVGSKTFRPYVITRYQPVIRLDRARPVGVPCDAGMSSFVDCMKAVYDGEMRRTKFYSADHETLVPRVIPNLGYSTMKWKAEEYAEKVYRMMKHHTDMHFPASIIETFAHTGKSVYCRARRGLWTRRFPTWKEYLSLVRKMEA